MDAARGKIDALKRLQEVETKYSEGEDAFGNLQAELEACKEELALR